MKVIRLCCMFGVAVGGALLYYSLILNSSSNLVPVILPFPRKGGTVSTAFNIVNRGDFDVEVEIPWGSVVAKEPDRQLSCEFKVLVSDMNDGCIFADTVKVLLRNTLVSGIGTVIYSGPSIKIPARGEYQVKIVTQNIESKLSEHGAMILLHRNSDSVESGVAAYIAGVLGILLLSFSIVVLIVGVSICLRRTGVRRRGKRSTREVGRIGMGRIGTHN